MTLTLTGQTIYVIVNKIKYVTNTALINDVHNMQVLA